MAIEKLPSVHEAAPAIMSGSLHPRELVDFCLARINQFDDRLRAWVLVDADGARREADRLGELARRGEWLGHCMGFRLELRTLSTCDWPTLTQSSPLPRHGRRRRGRSVVRRLRSGRDSLGQDGHDRGSLVSIRRRLAILGI
ncbi:MAG: hypothetical protein R3C99_18315 [Pirellulaceae bacterium]